MPAETGEPYPSYVSALDADGNEVAGIRVPDVSVPVATHTGWVPRHPDTGGAGQFLDMMGTSLPFAATPGERQQRGDPRPSIAERYRDRDDYLARRAPPPKPWPRRATSSPRTSTWRSIWPPNATTCWRRSQSAPR